MVKGKMIPELNDEQKNQLREQVEELRDMDLKDPNNSAKLFLTEAIMTIIIVGEDEQPDLDKAEVNKRLDEIQKIIREYMGEELYHKFNEAQEEASERRREFEEKFNF